MQSLFENKFLGYQLQLAPPQNLTFAQPGYQVTVEKNFLLVSDFKQNLTAGEFMNVTIPYTGDNKAPFISTSEFGFGYTDVKNGTEYYASILNSQADVSAMAPYVNSTRLSLEINGLGLP